MKDYLNNPEITFDPKLSTVDNYNKFLKTVSRSFELLKAVLAKHKVLQGNLLIKAVERGDDLIFDIVLSDNWGLSTHEYEYEENPVSPDVEETVKDFFKQNYPHTYQLMADSNR